jgi:hypothetical protein
VCGADSEQHPGAASTFGGGGGDGEVTPEKRKYLDMRNECVDLRKALQSLSDSALLFLNYLDTVIGPEIPLEMGKKLAKAANLFDFVNDQVRFGHLGVDFRKDDKAAAIKKLRERRNIK